MYTSKAARRYASALLELAKERNEVDAILDDMEFIHNTLVGSNELVLFLKSPVVKFDDKQAVLKTLFHEEVQESTALFLKLLARKNRTKILQDVSRAFIDLYKKHAGIIEVEVTVAQPLTDEQRRELHHELEQKTGKKVELAVQIDASVRGGMAVRIEDTVLDGTVKHKLQELEEQLLAAAAE